jgi:general secretion pathway protein G
MKRHAVVLGLCVTILSAGCAGTKDRERILRQDLYTLRSSIDNYTNDKKKAPQSLDDLVATGYLRAVPNDPITGKADWVDVEDDTPASAHRKAAGVVDVHSASQATACDGTAYSTW